MTERPWTVTDAKSLVEEALTLDYFDGDLPEGAAIPAYFLPGQGNLVVVVGENASGKSFFRRVVSSICRVSKIEAMPLSMEGRSDDFGGLKCMVYGSEQDESTGACSSHMVLKGVQTCRARTEKHVIIWDEPDIGLSDNGAAGMGQFIAQSQHDANPLTLASIVITHSKPLLGQLVALNPHYVHLGDIVCPQDLQAFIDKPVVPRDIKEIYETGRTRWTKIQHILNERKKAKS